MNALLTASRKGSDPRSNAIAAALTLVPGQGHFYKGHVAAGFLCMFLGMPIALWIGILLPAESGHAGAGLLFPILCWTALGLDAYYEKDRRNHHWLPPRDNA